jgi:hypothetical protein
MIVEGPQILQNHFWVKMTEHKLRRAYLLIARARDWKKYLWSESKKGHSLTIENPLQSPNGAFHQIYAHHYLLPGRQNKSGSFY